METIEGNRAIAEFMQFDIEGNTQWYDDEDWGGLVPRKLERPGEVDDLQYHSSWDWLMPVVEKIWGLGAWEYSIIQNACTIYGDHEQPPYIVGQGVTTIEATWSAAIQFIQWYNTAKPQPNATK